MYKTADRQNVKKQFSVILGKGFWYNFTSRKYTVNTDQSYFAAMICTLAGLQYNMKVKELLFV